MIDYDIFTLDNGLRVVHNYDPDTAMVAVNTLFDVGSRDETKGKTGLAHLIEHLMFGGSEHVADFDAEMERAGGVNNAFTSCDFTNYYDLAPAANIESLLWLESDRLLSPAFTETLLETQRSVVIEEFKQTHLNRPFGDLWHRLRALAYKTHPYSVPTIGADIEDIRGLGMEDVKTFFFSHYAPNNAVLGISGNIELSRCRELVEKWYADVPRRDIAPRHYEPEAPLEGVREETVTGSVPCGMVVLAFPMAGYGGDGYVECDLLTDILASGRSARLTQTLMRNEIFAQADASIVGSEEPGLLMIRARLAEGMENCVAEAQGLMIEQAVALRNITAAERDRAVNRFASNNAFGLLGVAQRAEALAQAVMHGEDINAREALYRAVSVESLRRVAERVADPSRMCVLRYLPA